MELKEKNNLWLWFYKYYHTYSFTEANPNSICPLTWKGLLGLIVFIFSMAVNIIIFITSIFKREKFLETKEELSAPPVLILFLNFLIIVCYTFGLIIIKKLLKIATFSELPWWSFLVSIFIIPSIIAIVFTIIYFMGVQSENISITKKNSIIVKRVEDWHNKTCTKITWK